MFLGSHRVLSASPGWQNGISVLNQREEGGNLTVEKDNKVSYPEEWDVSLWLVWLSGLGVLPQTGRLQVRFPVRARAWVAGQVPGGRGGA